MKAKTDFLGVLRPSPSVMPFLSLFWINFALAAPCGILKLYYENSSFELWRLYKPNMRSSSKLKPSWLHSASILLPFPLDFEAPTPFRNRSRPGIHFRSLLSAMLGPIGRSQGANLGPQGAREAPRRRPGGAREAPGRRPGAAPKGSGNAWKPDRVLEPPGTPKILPKGPQNAAKMTPKNSKNYHRRTSK